MYAKGERGAMSNEVKKVRNRKEERINNEITEGYKEEEFRNIRKSERRGIKR